MLIDIDSIFDDNGPMSTVLNGYSRREQQVKVSKMIHNIMNSKGTLIAECPTGSGKSFMYLIPAFIQAITKGQRTIISTHTISLQGQLMEKDVDTVKKLFGEAGKHIKVVQLKGRSNYLCNVALENSKQDLFKQTDTQFKKIVKWSDKTTTGEKSELSFNYNEWSELTSTPDTCAKDKCPLIGQCHYYKARAAMDEADIIIVNHALFFADILAQEFTEEISGLDNVEGILPEYSNVVFDEAHHLEDVATQAFGTEVSSRRIPKLLDKLSKVSDIRVDLALAVNNDLFAPFIQDIGENIITVDGDTLEELSHVTVSIASINYQIKKKTEFGDGLFSKSKENIQLQGIGNSLTKASRELGTILRASITDNVIWGKVSEVGKGSKRERKVDINCTPISVANHLKERVWDRFKNKGVSCTMVSATLATNNNFTYLKKRLGIGSGATEVIVDSPFNFQDHALLYIPRDLMEPLQSPTQEYIDAVYKEIKRLLLLTEGRAFCLFTSNYMKQKIGDLLLGDKRYKVFVQGSMSNSKLLEEFRDSKNGVLCGVKSFSEGIDVQGEQLSLVCIDRIPFTVPTGPVQQAKIKHLEKQGGNSFKDFCMPQAQISLKQSAGRLIRTSSDVGIIAILDTRLTSKSYGASMIKSLPNMKLTNSYEETREWWNNVNKSTV